MMKGGERAFAEAYIDDAIVQQLVGQLLWAHKVLVLTRLKKAEQRRGAVDLRKTALTTWRYNRRKF